VTTKIDLGFFLIAGIDEAESFVAWHQSDHICEQFRIPGLTWR
jgi:hypothetical protein